MNNCMIKYVLLGFIITGRIAYGEVQDRLVLRIRTAIEAVCRTLPQHSVGRNLYMKEFSYKYGQIPAYRELSEAVSNNFSEVFSSFELCATNDLCRMVLLSSSWAYDDDYYLSSFSNVIDFVVSGKISKDEFRWFRYGSRNPHILGLLPMEFDRPGVSNIVLRMQECTGETNYCQRILSGAAKEDAARYLDGMR